MNPRVSDSPIQFEKAEYEGGARDACAACGARIHDTYWETNGQIVCGRCRDKLLRDRAPGAIAQALSWGLAVAAAGSLAWALALKAGLVAGIIAVGIGWGMGWAMQKATERRTNRTLQVAAVAFTLLSVLGGFATFFLFSFEGALTPASVATASVFAFIALFRESGPLTWIIVAFGLWEAWRRTAPVEWNVTGPYRLSETAPAPADPPPPAEGASGG